MDSSTWTPCIPLPFNVSPRASPVQLVLGCPTISANNTDIISGLRTKFLVLFWFFYLWEAAMHYTALEHSMKNLNEDNKQWTEVFEAFLYIFKFSPRTPRKKPGYILGK